MSVDPYYNMDEPENVLYVRTPSQKTKYYITEFTWKSRIGKFIETENALKLLRAESGEGMWGYRVRAQGNFFFKWWKCLKFTVALVACICECIENSWIIHFKRMNCMVCVLELKKKKKALLKKKRGW